jgi:ABC-type multidrug transport system ATPase subunit
LRGRVDLVRALINEPKLLLFDEVTIDFDSEGLKVITGVLGDLAGGEPTVIATTPGLEGVELLAIPAFSSPTAVQHP